jgi:hypothetical protein
MRKVCQQIPSQTQRTRTNERAVEELFAETISISEHERKPIVRCVAAVQGTRRVVDQPRVEEKKNNQLGATFKC